MLTARPPSLHCSVLRAPTAGLPLPLGGVGPLPESLALLPRGQQPGRRPPPDAQLRRQLPPLPEPSPGPEAAVIGR